MADWLIRIEDTGSGSAAFVPVQPGGSPGGPLKTFEDDSVTWNNTTDQDHWPWPTDETFQPWDESKVSKELMTYLSGQIPPHQPSDVIFNIPEAGSTDFGSTIYYYCKLHPEEHGTITIRPTPSG